MKIVTSILLSTALLYAGEIIKMTEQQESDLGVRIQAVKQIENIKYGPYNGKVVVDKKDKISISSNLSSVVKDIYVREFQEVKKGEKLITIHSKELLHLQKEYIQALIESKNIDETYARDKNLFDEGIISSKKLMASKKEKQESDLQKSLAKNYLLSSGLSDLLVRKIEKTYTPIIEIDIFSPKDGVVYDIDVNVGEVIGSEKNMLTLYADGKRFVELVVPVTMVKNLSIGDRCSFDIFSATITNIGRVINNESQSVELRASIEDAKDIVINRIYDVMILKEVGNSVKIKKSALVYDGENSLVFKKVDGGYEVTPVEVVSEGPVCYIVRGELREEDEVAVVSTSALLSAMEAEDE